MCKIESLYQFYIPKFCRNMWELKYSLLCPTKVAIASYIYNLSVECVRKKQTTV